MFEKFPKLEKYTKRGFDSLLLYFGYNIDYMKNLEKPEPEKQSPNCYMTLSTQELNKICIKFLMFAFKNSKIQGHTDTHIFTHVRV